MIDQDAKSKLLCELEGGGKLVAKPGGQLVLSMPGPLGVVCDVEISRELLDVFARHWMDLHGIQYRTATIKLPEPEAAT